MLQAIKYITVSLIALSFALLNNQFVSAEEQNRIIERNDGYLLIVVYTLLSVIALFTFFSLINLCFFKTIKYWMGFPKRRWAPLIIYEETNSKFRLFMINTFSFCKMNNIINKN